MGNLFLTQQTNDLVKIVSYNIWTQLMPGTENALELRAERLKQVISQYKPDSIGFQEARYEWMEWLGQNLTDYSYVGVGRENGKIDPECGEAAPIFYLKDKFNLLDSGTFWLSETPEIPSIGWDAAYKRICTWAVLENKQTKECYAHINTHLDNVGETARVEGVKLILDKIDELGATYPIVCTGDFNANMYSEPYKLMVEHENEDSGVRMADSLFCAEEVINRGGTMPNLNVSPSDSEREVDGGFAIDHCFISVNDFNVKLYKVMRDTVDNKYVSDHYGVYVELTFRQKREKGQCLDPSI